MRRAALLLIALGLVLAPPAGAQPKGRLTTAAPAAATALRGALPAAPPAAEAAYPALPPHAPGVSTAASARDPGQCRLTCARRYYFCLATDAADECPQAWGQCRAACDAPGPARPGQADFPG